MAVPDLDIPQLSNFCSLPQASVNTLLDAPTADLVRGLLQKISTRAHEYNELKSEKLRSSVELESAVRGQETKNRILKTQLEKSHHEVEDTQQKLQVQESLTTSLETELHDLRTSTSTSASDINGLQVRINSLESSNRDTLSLLDSKNTAYDKLTGELNAQHEKTVELRRQVSALEQSLHEKESSLSSAASKEQVQKEAIARLERRNDFVENELKAKAEEHTKFRKEKSKQLIQLSQQNEEESAKVRQLQSTEINLRRTLEDISEKAEERSQKIHGLQEEFAQKEDAFRQELDATNRLANLREKSATTERGRAQELSDQVSSLRQQIVRDVGHAQAELDTEHSGLVAAEEKIAELELQIEHLQSDLASHNDPEAAPNTPRRGVNGFNPQSSVRGDTTPLSLSPSSSRIKGGFNATQLVSDYNELKRQLNYEKRSNEQLKNTIDALMADMEEQSPEIQDLRTEHERWQSEVSDLSSLVDTVSKERDRAVKAAKKQEGQVEAKNKEGEVLRQQLRDISSQVKMLLFEAHLRDERQEDPSVAGHAQLGRLAHGDVDIEITEGSTDTDKYINTNLVVFRNIAELQNKNSDLLKITREIGERLENDEAMRKQAEEARNWEDLQHKYERCKDEMKSLVTQSQSYIRERDMFRQMLDNRGHTHQSSDLTSILGISVNGDGPTTASAESHLLSSIENNASAKDMADYAKLLKDMQAHFDAYRNEAATDRSTMKEQIDGLSKANSELRSEAVRSNSQAALTHERYEMLQANYTMLKSENTELQRRSQTFYENAAKQELRGQQAAEELVEARALENSLRNEAANLKAEKEFWKTVEKRINDDNENLINERGRLNSLNSSLQSLLNEREHSDNETRRRLQAQIESLETDLQRTTASLREETEEAKRFTSRREYEHQQSQKRIDDLMSSLGTSREDLAKASTAKDHLSRQVDSLTIELRSAKERLEVLQSTPSAVSSDGANASNSTGQAQDSVLSHEQELGVRISELQRDLDLANKEIEDVRAQVDQYKAISQASEDELNSMNETQDLYRQEHDTLITEKDAKIRELEQRLDEISTELASTNTEMDEFRSKEAENDRSLEDQRKDFENQLARLKDEHDRHEAAAQYYQQDLKAQASIAQQAQQNYENELVKHGDAAKALQKVRGELSEIKVELVEARTEAETARSNLGQSEESWADSKERFEREILELRTARQDLKGQNDLLHQQLETLTTAHKRSTDGHEPMQEGSPNAGLDNLQEVVKYLRREKEIVDVQLELSSQEAKRLKQQLDYTQSQLDDARLKLNQQRRAEADRERSVLDHNKLIETIHDLNTHRESNVTLRAESRQAQAALAKRNAEIDELKAQIEPLQEELLDLKGEREAHAGEVKLLKENADRWQQRAQNVLQKYDRVDPAELEALKEQAKSLENERDELLSSKQTLQEQLDAVNRQIAQVQEQSNDRVETMKARLTEQFKSRSKTLSDRIKERDAALQTAVTEKQGLEQRLNESSDLQAQLDAAKAERDAAVDNATTANAGSTGTNQGGGEEGEVDESNEKESIQVALQVSQSALQSAEAKVIEEGSKNVGLQKQLAMSTSRIADLEAEITQLKATHEAVGRQLSEVQSLQQHVAEPILSVGMEEQMQKLRDDLAQAQQDAENLRTTASVNASLANTSGNDGTKSVADQVAEHVDEVRKELERRHDERIKTNDENYNKRVEAMKSQLNKKLTEGRNQYRQSISAEHEQAMQALKTEHEQQMRQLRERHEEEVEELRRHEASQLSEVRASLEKEVQGRVSADGNAAAKPDAQTPFTSWQPTEQEAKSFVQSNDVVKTIVKQNIISQINKQKDEIAARLKGEHEKNLAEQLASAQERARIAKEHAVMMEGKKTALQVNMANNKAKIAQFKIDVVQKAAQDTPQKPVKEVWDTAKDARPPQAPTSQQSQQPAIISPSPAVMPGTFGQPSPAIQNAPSKPTEQSKSVIPNAQGSALGSGVFGRPTPTQPSAQVQPPKSQEQQDTKPQSVGAVLTSTSTAANAPQRPATSGIPQRQPQNAASQPNAGAGLSALKPLQSGLPIARGGAVRGNQRGRGSGIGRGGPGLDTSRVQGHPQGRGSPNSAGMNPSAKQFVPGIKRPREESQDGPQGAPGPEKRIRGGGVGS